MKYYLEDDFDVAVEQALCEMEERGETLPTVWADGTEEQPQG